jgi:SAM-dependent methyltransferase
VGNIRTVVGEIDDPKFPETALDMAFLVYAIHDFGRPAAFLRNLHRYLRPGATVVVIDQDPERAGDTGHFLTRKRLVEVFAEGGFELAGEETFLARDLVLVFRASRPRPGQRSSSPPQAPENDPPPGRI